MKVVEMVVLEVVVVLAVPEVAVVVVVVLAVPEVAVVVVVGSVVGLVAVGSVVAASVVVGLVVVLAVLEVAVVWAVNPSLATHSEVHLCFHSRLSFQTWLATLWQPETYLLKITANSCPSL